MTTSLATAQDKLATITTSEAKNVIDKVINDLRNQGNKEILISLDDVAIFHYAITTNIQLRDYLLGLATDSESVAELRNALYCVSRMMLQSELTTYEIDTVLASYAYRMDDVYGATQFLGEALNKKYSLAILLSRVFSAGWQVEAFDIMTQELHPKILQTLEETASDTVNESLR